MPAYEFICETCGKTFEKQLAFDADQSKVRCPSGHTHIHRQYSAPPVVFKGSGYYVTDHRKSSTSQTDK
jgi:putative FmdB family regulatory protein